MIVITGANGNLGRGIVESLLTRIPADHIGVSVRDTAKAADLAERGVRVRHGDFKDPETLAASFEGADQVLMVSVDGIGEKSVAMNRTAIDAAKAAGVKRVLYTSHMGAGRDSPFLAAVDHAATEEYLQQSGIPYTSLRHGFYANTAQMIIDQAAQTGVLIAPEAGPFNWTHPGDLAEADAWVLAHEGEFEGPTPPLAATEQLTLDQLAQIASDASGREVVVKTVPAEEYVRTMADHGMPEDLARLLVGMFEASSDGDFATDDKTLEKILGRPTTTVKELVEEQSSKK